MVGAVVAAVAAGPRTDPAAAPACSWEQRSYDPAAPDNYSFRATCDPAADVRAVIRGGTELTGSVGGVPLRLSVDPGSDPAMFDTIWDGSLGGAPVRLVTSGFEVVDGSRLGDADLRCVGPSVLTGDWTWLEVDRAPVTVEYGGDADPNVVAALCNLMTVGLPGGSFGFAKGGLEAPPSA